MQCTDEEMAAWFGITRETLVRRKKGDILDAIERGKAKGRASLRRAQFQNALNGNATMQIWLGKQLLGQRDIVTTEHTGADGGPIQLNDAREQFARRIAELAARRPAASGNSTVE